MRDRWLLALLGGTLVGAALALLLQAAIARTATPMAPQRAFWQLLLFALAGGLSGSALRAVTALQASSPEPEYHRRRPSGWLRRRPRR